MSYDDLKLLLNLDFCLRKLEKRGDVIDTAFEFDCLHYLNTVSDSHAS